MAKKFNRIEEEFIEDARIVWANFTGRPTKSNPNGGVIAFDVILDEETAARLKDIGWNVRWYENEQKPDASFWHLNIKIGFNYNPPQIHRICGDYCYELNEKTIGQLAKDQIQTMDITFTPYIYDVNGKTGVKAYLSEMAVVVRESPIAKKYGRFFRNGEDDFDQPFDV